MNIITENAEVAVLEELKLCWETSPTHRCLHMKLSAYESEQDDWMDDIFSTVKNVLDDVSATIYVCFDSDIFVLTRYITQKKTQDLLDHLNGVMDCPLSSNHLQLSEIGVHWTALRQICLKKIENLKLLLAAKNRKKPNADLPALRKGDAIKMISQELVASLAERRAGREEAEILIVEDDPMSQRLIKNALKNTYPISIVGDGNGAIMSYVKRAPDILFLDIGLPDINGHEVLKTIFQFDPQAFVVMFSGYGDRENVTKAIELGAKGFVAKPFSQEKILQYIQKSPFVQGKIRKEVCDGNSIH